MNVRRMVCVSALVLVGTPACGTSNDPAAQGSGAPSGSPAAAPAAGGKTLKFSQDECTFEVSAPEELTQSTKDGMSQTFKGKTVWFQGFAGTAHYGLEQLGGLFMMGNKGQPLFKGTTGGLNLVIAESPTAPPENKIMGQGEEADVKGRSLGCSFLCGGTKEREADVVAMCKGVRITYDESKAPK